MRLLALAVPLSIVTLSALSAPRHDDLAASSLISDNLCTPPHDDTTKWTPVSLQMMSLHVPPRFAFGGSALGRDAWYSFSGRDIELVIGDADVRVPESFYGGNVSGRISGVIDPSISGQRDIEHVQLASCQTMIGSRMAFITSYSWTVHTGGLGGPGDSRHYLAIAQFLATGALPSAYVAIGSLYKSDLMTYRQVFWTVHFAGLETAVASPPVCGDTAPPPRGTVGEFLDTSVVSMLANGASPPLPKGSGTVLLRFDSTGDVAGVSVGATLMPDAAQKQLGAIVGSNVIAQKPGSVTHVRIKVTVGDSALAYTLLGVGNCTH